MKRKLLRMTLVGLIVTMVFINNSSVLACTSFYLGSETTESGSSYWGRTEDSYAHFSKLHEVKEGQSHKAGDMWESTSGFKWPYPAQSLRYTVVKDSIHNEGAQPEPYGQVGMNEKNVAITATLTFYSRPEIIGKQDKERDQWLVEGKDPFIEGGLTEENVVSIVLMQAKTAREGAELIAQIVDTLGAGENGGIMVGDPNERWYMQLLSGHQYVAVKAPDDLIGLSPNMIGNVDLSDKENVICSAGLVRVPEAAGTLVKDEAGMIKIADSYEDQPSEVNSRLWLGYYYLFDQENAQALTPAYIDYFIVPRTAKDYTTYEALRLLAERVATDLSIALSQETYDYVKEILGELRAFQEAGTQGDFVPSALGDEGALPHYKIETRKPTKGIDGLVALVILATLFNGCGHSQ